MNDSTLDQLSRQLGASASRRNVFRLVGGGVVGARLVGVGLHEPAAKSQKGKHKGHKRAGKVTNADTSIPVKGHGAGGVQFTGLLDLTSFDVNDTNDGLVALGTLTGQLRHGKHGTQDVTDTPVTLPVSIPGVDLSSASRASAQQGSAAATCQILNLTLGPLDLNLLGLMIHLNQVHLVIMAQAGGGLLGDLLCSIANLLNGGLSGILNQLVTLLNQLLAGLNSV
jgi:hypothetical protein